MPRRIDRARALQVLVQARYSSGEVSVASHHRVEYLGCRTGSGSSTVRVLVFAATVEADSRSQVSRFACMEDFHRVEDSTTLERESLTCALELGVQQS